MAEGTVGRGNSRRRKTCWLARASRLWSSSGRPGSAGEPEVTMRSGSPPVCISMVVISKAPAWKGVDAMAGLFDGDRRVSDGDRRVFDGDRRVFDGYRRVVEADPAVRSEEHTSELQSLMRTSYAVFCLKKKKTKQ